MVPGFFWVEFYINHSKLNLTLSGYEIYHLKINMYLKGLGDPHGSLDHTLGTVASVKLAHGHQEGCARLFIAVSFVIEKTRNNVNIIHQQENE